MPILINNETGYAENLHGEAASKALQAGTHDVPLNDAQGNPISAPQSEVANLISTGATKPTEEHFGRMLDTAKYSTPGQQLATGVEGAASAFSFGASTGLERLMGVPAEDIRKRRETNPGAHLAGEVTGIGLGMLTGTGEAALLARAGEAVGAKVLASGGASVLTRIGSEAAKLAAESALQQSGDEISKMFYNDPNQSVQTVVSNVGLAGILGAVGGGGLGSVKELWKLGPGKRAQSMLDALKKHSGDTDIVGEMPNIEPVVAKKPQSGWDQLQAGPNVPYKAPVLEQAAASIPVGDAPASIWNTIKKIPPSAVGMAAELVLPGSGIMTYAVKKLMNIIGTGSEDATKMTMLKFLGASEITNAPAFKAAVDMAQAFIKGETVLNKAADSVLRIGAYELPTEIADARDREKLQKQLDMLEANPDSVLNIGGETGHYMPEHAAALAQTSSQAIQYLKSIKPVLTPQNPMDSQLKPNKVAEANYARAMDIAVNPNLVLNAVKNGTLSSSDITHLRSLYPALMANMQQKLSMAMINSKAKNIEIPYRTKIGLSMFLGQPMESSLSGATIAASQPLSTPMQSNVPAPRSSGGSKMNSLQKLPSLLSTPQRSRESYRSTGRR